MDHDAPPGSKGRRMMLRKLRLYLWWKGQLSKRKQDGKSHFGLPDHGSRSTDGHERMYGDGEEISEALKRKDKLVADRAASRRRVRGGAPATAAPSGGRHAAKGVLQDTVMGNIQNEADNFAELCVSSLGLLHGNKLMALLIRWASQNGQALELPMALAEDMPLLDFGSGTFEDEFDQHYGLLPPEQTVLVRAFSDDSDDRVLAEIRPKFIVMFEPNMEFIRRIEVCIQISILIVSALLMVDLRYKVYKSSNPGLGVRVYHMVYSNSCEEHKYLAGIRKEKESFERLIKERGASFSLLFLYYLEPTRV